ncbi:GntR family transcriptional regulator [Dyadobacter fanqingshengii]|uniref:GntR family transcriptional regulator n=1 Tax=Dyadobacter fanqingshengii TaxID=2906443 RepID=A0A9X1PCP8_9BACT|nr:GntR family transcriptional regulator [Dyadobacter fanqingshengii]MCF0041145.1 GntR family transcriptional regulator [Dyadobacter fanqingshengii]USJ37129.1 GntR family transcriptional regulator [Dyadobacter fanqingshengii]
MRDLIKIDALSKQPKYQQILNEVISSIEKGTLNHGQQLPSISELSSWQNVAKVTVAKAYEDLRKRGVIQAKHGKGFYVANTAVKGALNVFLLFDTLNAYKEILYFALKSRLPDGSQLSLFFHHYDRALFDDLITNNLNNYNYFVIMPHFNEDVSATLNRISKDRLVIIDKAAEEVSGNYAAVFQDFENDIYSALKSGLDLLKKYKKLTLVLAKGQFQFVPDGIIKGFKRFCEDFEMDCQIADQFSDDMIRKQEAYLLFADRDLIDFVKHVHRTGLHLGKDVGLISYDDTPMKEILEGGITVISTDFEQMGQTLSKIIDQKLTTKTANPSSLIRRKSL